MIMTTYKIPSKCDNGGNVFKVAEMELLTKIDFIEMFSEIDESKEIDIVTYSFFDEEFVKNLLKGKKNVRVLLSSNHKKSSDYKTIIENACLGADVKLTDKTHAKIVLIAPDFVYLGSQNIGDSDWFQAGVLFKNDVVIYDYYKKIVDDFEKGKKLYNYPQKSNTFIESTKNNIKYKIPFVTDKPSIKINNIDVKLSTMLNWNQKFNGYHGRKIIVTTYSLPNYDYARTMIEKILNQGNQLTIYANDISSSILKKLSEEFPELSYMTFPNLHSKMILVEENIVWLSSQNFGTSTWFENTINIKSKEAYRYFYNRLNEYISMYL